MSRGEGSKAARRMNAGRFEPEPEPEPCEESYKETVINQQGAKLRAEERRLKETLRET